MGVLVRSVVLGVAAGGRSSVGFAVPVLVATRGRRGRAARLLRAAARTAVLGEAVGDKSPAAPSRLRPMVLAGRMLSGAVGAAGLALAERRSAAAVVLALPLGGAGAWCGSVAGAGWREWAAGRGPLAPRTDLRAALVEDAAVGALAAALLTTA